ncbi:hypothetical protein KEM54_000617 [Ascosphaera aggregata]|nr:hypothetical protein KEM54_000617 [Ascosphaera aggregata]
MTSLLLNPHTCGSTRAQQAQAPASSSLVPSPSTSSEKNEDSIPASIFFNSELRKVLPPRCEGPGAASFSALSGRRKYSTATKGDGAGALNRNEEMSHISPSAHATATAITTKRMRLPLLGTSSGSAKRLSTSNIGKIGSSYVRNIHNTTPSNLPQETRPRSLCADEGANTPHESERVNDQQRLTLSTINPNVVRAKYAVRGELAVRAERYRVALEKQGAGAAGLPFDSVIFANIGNPQQLDQKPITFFRQVLSIIENPTLLSLRNGPLKECGYHDDVFDRAEKLLKSVGSVGAYSQSAGIPLARQSVARYLEERDGFAASPDDIFLTAGASSGVNTLLNVICDGPKTGVLIPIPQYPLYTATLAVLNAKCVPYYLDEGDGWATDVDGIQNSLIEARNQGIDVRAIAVINPGNPTGSSLSPEAVKRVLQLAARERLVVIADEVYQTNVFSQDKNAFTSFKKALRTLQREKPDEDFDSVELVSLNSVSKGMVGECGHRGGYFELNGFKPEVREQIYKFVSIGLCPPVIGQCLVELMVNPPRPGDPSYPLYDEEYNYIKKQMKSRAMALYTAFKEMEGVTCATPTGSMYLYPQLTLPKRAIEAAKESGMQPDEFYCGKLLDATGVCVVPGSGFGQVEGTFHLRTTFLAPGTAWVGRIVEFHKQFWREFGDK